MSASLISDGVIIKECTIAKDRPNLKQLCLDYLGGSVAIEVCAHNPWISRFLTVQGMKVTVANACKPRASLVRQRTEWSTPSAARHQIHGYAHPFHQPITSHQRSLRRRRLDRARAPQRPIQRYLQTTARQQNWLITIKSSFAKFQRF